MAFDYIHYRRNKFTGKLKLYKRTFKMASLIQRFAPGKRVSILDVGAADGVMLGYFKINLNTDHCAGIEPDFSFLKSTQNNSLPLVQAVAETLPFKDRAFDVITAASVLDHIQDCGLFFKECQRVLKKDGIIVLSLVSGFYDLIAVKLKVKEDDHLRRFSEASLRQLLEGEGYRVQYLSRFALPLPNFRFFQSLEKLLEKTIFRHLMFYLIAVAQKAG